MPTEDIGAKWRARTREAARTGDLRKLKAEGGKLAREAPQEYWALAWRTITDDLSNLGRWLASAPPDGIPILLAVATEVLRIAEDAHRSAGKRYAQYVDDSAELFLYDVELAVKLLPDVRRFLPRPDMSNLDAVLERYEDIMATYKRRLAYVAGLLDLIDGLDPSLPKLASRSIAYLERRVREHPAGMGQGLGLGEDYHHVRNSIAHRTYVVDRGAKAIRFRDEGIRSKHGLPSRWEKELPYSEFASM